MGQPLYWPDTWSGCLTRPRFIVTQTNTVTIRYRGCTLI